VKHFIDNVMCVWYWVTKIFYGQGFTSKLKTCGLKNVKAGQGADSLRLMRSKIQKLWRKWNFDKSQKAISMKKS